MKRMVPTEQINLLASLASQGVTPERIAGIEADVGDTQKMIADEYDATATYAVGDICIHDGKLYQCNTAITAAEEWTAAHWTVIQVPDLVKPIYYHPVTIFNIATPTLGYVSLLIIDNNPSAYTKTTLLSKLSELSRVAPISGFLYNSVASKYLTTAYAFKHSDSKFYVTGLYSDGAVETQPTINLNDFINDANSSVNDGVNKIN